MDKGSRGPWHNHDDFCLDFHSAQLVIERGITLDAFASFRNKLCEKYYSRGFEIEAAGQDFFQQQFSSLEVVLLHPHPRMLIPALRHAAKFGIQAVVVFHIWHMLNSTFMLLKGGHLPAAATEVVVCHPHFTGSLNAPAFWGQCNFDTIIFKIQLLSGLSLEEQLAEKLAFCLYGGCSYCGL